MIYFCVRGIQYLRPSLLFSHPQVGSSQAGTGGFLDPLLGTGILTLIGIALATPLAVGAALWIVEYGRPSWLARVVESSIEIVAGTPDILIALFGLTIFQLGLFAPFSFTAEGGGVYGRSFLAAGTMMSLIALPSIYTATRDGLQAVPAHMREAAYALGKTRIATIRRVLMPSVRSNVATGVTLGVSRIIGDTAIIIFLLGATLRIEPQGSVPVLGLLRGTGSTLTSYIFYNSPAGEGGAPAEGLRGRVRAAGLRPAAQPPRRPHRPLAGRLAQASPSPARSSEPPARPPRLAFTSPLQPLTSLAQ